MGTSCEERVGGDTRFSCAQKSSVIGSYLFSEEQPAKKARRMQGRRREIFTSVVLRFEDSNDPPNGPSLPDKSDFARRMVGDDLVGKL
jgi:hypothetical protein